VCDRPGNVDALTRECNSRCPSRSQVLCRVMLSNTASKTDANMCNALRTVVRGDAVVCGGGRLM